MSEERISTLFKKAESDLSKAREELYKPEEDVVEYSACISARSALYHYLGCLYVMDSEGLDEENFTALKKGIKTVDELIGFTSQNHEGIKNIDFTPMRCSCNNVKDVLNNDEIYFCNNVNIVRTCTELAEQVRELVIDSAYGGINPVAESS